MERLPTGVAGLDEVTGGGIPAGTTVVIGGLPGTGKTVLANQSVFANATSERKALIVSTASEPISRMIRFMQTFRFFDVNKVGKEILYEDLGPRLAEEGSNQVLAWLEDLVTKTQPGLLVVDSFKALADLAEDRGEFRRAFYRFAAQMATLDCVSLLVGEYDPLDGGQTKAEFSIVDGIVFLYNRQVGLHDRRCLRIQKLRGTSYATGEHSFRITSEGIQVFPRFRTPFSPISYEVPEERISTGNPGLDDMFSGGPLRGTTTLVIGDPGSGKTVTCLHFLLRGALAGEPGLYVSFEENPSQLRRIAQNFGFDFDDLQRRGLAQLFYTSPVELDIDEHVPKIARYVEDIGAKRVVIDSVLDLEAGAFFDRERYFNYVYSLVEWFKQKRISVFMTAQTSTMFGNTLVLTGRGLSLIADNLLVLRYVPKGTEIRRVVAVLSARGSDHSKEVQEFRITEERGPEVGEPIDAGRSLLGIVLPNGSIE